MIRPELKGTLFLDLLFSISSRLQGMSNSASKFCEIDCSYRINLSKDQEKISIFLNFSKCADSLNCYIWETMTSVTKFGLVPFSGTGSAVKVFTSHSTMPDQISRNFFS